MWASKKLQYVNECRYITPNIENCYKLLTANTLYLIIARKTQVVLRSKDWVDAIVSQVDYKAIAAIAATKAGNFMLIDHCKCRWISYSKSRRLNNDFPLLIRTCFEGLYCALISSTKHENSLALAAWRVGKSGYSKIWQTPPLVLFDGKWWCFLEISASILSSYEEYLL